MNNIVDSIASCDINDAKQKEALIAQFKALWDNSALQHRLREGILLIKHHNHPKMSAEQLTAIQTWLEGFNQNLEKQIDAELEHAVEDQSVADVTCLKDTFLLDDFFMEKAFELGQEFYNTKEFEYAASVFTVAVVLDTLSPEAWISLGLAEGGLQHEEEAERALGLALALAPADYMVIYYVGKYYFDKGDKTTAHGFFKIIVEAKEVDHSLKQICNTLITQI